MEKTFYVTYLETAKHKKFQNGIIWLQNKRQNSYLNYLRVVYNLVATVRQKNNNNNKKRQKLSYPEQFLTLSTTDIWSWIILCASGYPVCYRMLSSRPVLYQLDAIGTLPPTSVKPKISPDIVCLRTTDLQQLPNLSHNHCNHISPLGFSPSSFSDTGLQCWPATVPVLTTPTPDSIILPSSCIFPISWLVSVGCLKILFRMRPNVCVWWQGRVGNYRTGEK